MTRTDKATAIATYEAPAIEQEITSESLARESLHASNSGSQINGRIDVGD